MNLPTVATEQQADCFAGAWAGSGRRRRSVGRAVHRRRHPRGADRHDQSAATRSGIDQFTAPGGHGSGFDRVGAFQVGFQQGPGSCAELIDDPLPLMPTQFIDQRDIANEGNAPFGYERRRAVRIPVPDLNLLWDNDLDSEFANFEPLTLVSVQRSPRSIVPRRSGSSNSVSRCARPRTRCTSTSPLRSSCTTSWATSRSATCSESPGRSTSRSPARQICAASRAPAQNDCLVGAWVKTVIPDPRPVSCPPRVTRAGRSISPNDLDEAIQTAIVIGDPTSSTDVLGSAFEKIDSFRQGVLGGIDACS